MKDIPSPTGPTSDSHIQAHIEKIINDTLETKTNGLSAETRLDQIQNLDSFGIITLFMSIEQSFGLQFTTDEIIAVKTIGDIHKGVASKLNR